MGFPKGNRCPVLNRSKAVASIKIGSAEGLRVVFQWLLVGSNVHRPPANTLPRIASRSNRRMATESKRFTAKGEVQFLSISIRFIWVLQVARTLFSARFPAPSGADGMVLLLKPQIFTLERNRQAKCQGPSKIASGAVGGGVWNREVGRSVIRAGPSLRMALLF